MQAQRMETCLYTPEYLEWRRRPLVLAGIPSLSLPILPFVFFPSFLDWALLSADLAVIRRQKGICTPITVDCKQNEV